MVIIEQCHLTSGLQGGEKHESYKLEGEGGDNAVVL